MADKAFTVSVSGWPQVHKVLLQAGLSGSRALGGAMYEEAEMVIGDAKEDTPVDTGNLKNSGHVHPPVQTFSGPVVECGFGGTAGSGNQGKSNTKDVGYALIVHEDAEAKHKTGHAFYLKTALNKRLSGMEGRIAAGIRQRVKEFR